MSVARRALQVVAVIATLVIGVTAMAVIVTQTTWFKQWLRGFIVRQADGYVNGQVSIGHVGGNLFTGIELQDVRITMNGRTVVGVRELGLDYNPLTFVRGDVVLDHIRLDQPQLLLVRTAQGWNLARLIKARTPDPNEPKTRPTIEIGELSVSDGRVAIENADIPGVDVPSVIERIDASVGVTSNENALTVTVAHLSLRTDDPRFGINALSGVITRTANEVRLQQVSLRTEQSTLRVDGVIRNIESPTPAVDLRLSSDTLAIPEIAALVPALRGYDLQPAFELSAKGPVDQLALTVNVREPRVGHVSGNLTADVLAPAQRVAGQLQVEHLDLEPLTTSAATRSDITGQVRFDLALPGEGLPLSGTYAVDAAQAAIDGYRASDVVAEGRIDGQTIRVDGRAKAYGGRATTRGTVTMGTPVALNLSGTVAGLDLRNLPPSLDVPDVPSHLQLSYTLTGRGAAYSGTARMAESQVTGATIAAGTTARFSIGSGAPTYAVQGDIANLDLQAIGSAFDIAALSADRFTSQITLHIDASGSGGGARYPLALDATGTVTHASMFGAAIPHLDFTAAVNHGDMHITTSGQFSDLNPARITGDQKVAGNLDGAVNLTATLRDYASGVTPDSIDVAGQITLSRSTIADFTIDSAAVDGQYANRFGHVTRMVVDGPDLKLTASGPIALNENGESNLTYHFESPSLDRLGAILGQPLTGAVVVDGALTGNATELVGYGTLTGSNLGYGDNNALSLTSNFDVEVPDLDVARTTVHAKTFATFVQVAGQQINQLDTDTTYSGSELFFSMEAIQPNRQLEAGGTVVFHPDHQEIHLPDLVLRSGPVEWRMAEGAAAAIDYGNDRIDVKNVELVSGDQSITADGILGSPSESLTVKASNVNVAQLSELALLPPGRVAGRLDATAMISGPVAAPHVDGEFALTQGAFESFMFESLAGSVDYADRGVALDVRLQQTPQAWITAKGFAPLTLFEGNPVAADHPHRQPAPGDMVDIAVQSSEIDLAVVEGFTTAVTDVGGTLRANFTVTGSGSDPHMVGDVVIQGGRFTVPALGTSYTGLDTTIDLRPDVVDISQMRILDDGGNALTIGGQLAVHQEAVGAVNVTLRANKFEVIDNEIGNLRLNTDLRVTGTLRQPRVEGSLDVATGTIDVAEVLARVTSSPYSTEAAAPVAEEPESAVAQVRRNAEIPAEADASVPEGGAETAPNTVAAAKESVRQNAEVAEPTPLTPAPTSPFNALALNISMAIPDDLVLKGEGLKAGGVGVSLGDVNITVGGMLQIRKAPGGSIRLIGDVNTVRGSYTFQGRRFEITRDGRIRFIGGDEIDPLLDIEASRVISGVEAIVQIGGTLKQPEISFRSNPPLEEADILSLIIFNQPVNQLGEGQQASLAQRAGALASGYVASGLARSIGNALNLNEFEIKASGENGAGPSVAFGEQFGQNLFVRLQQGFGSSSVTEFILEYQITELLRLRATAAQIPSAADRVQFRRVERGGLDLIFFFAY